MSETIELSNREQDVLQLLVEGLRNKEIASHLCISENTVEQHLKHIYEKLDVTNRVEASRWHWLHLEK